MARPAAVPAPTRSGPAPPLLRSTLLEGQDWLWHGFGTRRRRSWPAGFKLISLRQVHGSAIWRDPEIGAAGDGLISDRPARLLAIRTADCVPILIADPEKRVVAAIHAGWRGTRDRIAQKAVGDLRRHYGSHPGNLLCAIGPSIRACCYRVGEEVRMAFTATFADADDLFTPTDPDPDRLRYPLRFLNGAPPGHLPDQRWNLELAFLFDLAEANRRQLRAAGVAERHIELLPYCTVCRPDLFFSHRRQGARAGRMLSAIALRPAAPGAIPYNAEKP